MSKTCVVIMNSPFVTLGTLERPLLEREVFIHLIDAKTSDFSSIDMGKTDLLIILGGPQSPYETDKYPYLEKEIITSWINMKKPIIGIALGAQLIASALGAKVGPGQEKGLSMELGWRELELADEVEENLLSAFTQNSTKVLCWQNDYYELPKDAKPLAKAGQYGNQAFLVGDNAVALQFHAEVDHDIVSNWIDLLDHDFVDAGVDKDAFRLETHQNIKQMCNQASLFWSYWLDRIFISHLQRN